MSVVEATSSPKHTHWSRHQPKLQRVGCTPSHRANLVLSPCGTCTSPFHGICTLCFRMIDCCRVTRPAQPTSSRPAFLYFGPGDRQGLRFAAPPYCYWIRAHCLLPCRFTPSRRRRQKTKHHTITRTLNQEPNIYSPIVCMHLGALYPAFAAFGWKSFASPAHYHSTPIQPFTLMYE